MGIRISEVGLGPHICMCNHHTRGHHRSVAPGELWLSNHRLVTQAVPRLTWGQLLTGVAQPPDCLNQNLGVRHPDVSVFLKLPVDLTAWSS